MIIRHRWIALYFTLLFPCLAASVFADEPRGGDLETLVSRVRPSVVTIRVQGRDGDELGIGTGFVIDSDGLIATNFHVIQEGRPFTVETSNKRKLKVLSVEASDRIGDLAILKVAVGQQKLSELPLADDESPNQGSRVVAFGNPLGLRDSVVEGIVSAVREVEGREMIQLAMPIEPGNSGGPLVDEQGRVVGIINMKSAIDDNLGFALPIKNLITLRANLNPVTMDRWVRLGRLDPSKWQPIGGALWQQIGGKITARGAGKGFGGRSLCLSKQEAPKPPYDVSVMVKLDDESGAAGLAFHSDGEEQHYGFYPSAGKLRLTRFQGPSVYSWKVLQDVETEEYVPGQWNHLRVHVQSDRLTCYVNGQVAIESTDTSLSKGSVGLVKFRSTQPEFRGFRVETDATFQSLSPSDTSWLARLDDGDIQIERIDEPLVRQLADHAMLAGRELDRRARSLEQKSKQLRILAKDVRLAPTLVELEKLSEVKAEHQLLRGALLIAMLDDADLDIEAYVSQLDQMATEIREGVGPDASDIDRREALDRYLFQQNGFRGGIAEYYHPANSHLNRVIDDREGLPITMSILYIELGRRLDLQMEGVGLPGHFIVKHVMDEQTHQLIDVFEGGKRLSRGDADEIVRQYADRRMIAQSRTANDDGDSDSRLEQFDGDRDERSRARIDVAIRRGNGRTQPGRRRVSDDAGAASRHDRTKKSCDRGSRLAPPG